MTHTQHTKGPWRIATEKETGGNPFVVCAQDGTGICDASNDVPWMSSDEVRANVALLAAAPTMLEALNSIHDIAHNTSEEDSDVHRAALLQIGMLARDTIKLALTTEAPFPKADLPETALRAFPACEFKDDVMVIAEAKVRNLEAHDAMLGRMVTHWKSVSDMDTKALTERNAELAACKEQLAQHSSDVRGDSEDQDQRPLATHQDYIAALTALAEKISSLKSLITRVLGAHYGSQHPTESTENGCFTSDPLERALRLALEPTSSSSQDESCAGRSHDA